MKPTCLFLIAVLASPAMAEDATLIAPVFAQIVALPLPDGFQPVFENADAKSYILEAVPQGETLDAWTQMVTLTAAQGQGGQAGAAMGMANGLAAGYRNACPDQFVAEALPAPVVPGAVEVFAAFMGCTALRDAAAEAMVVLVLRGAEDVYTLQWAERANVSQWPVSYDLADWTPRLARLAAGTRLCAVVPGEPPPYPSCIGNEANGRRTVLHRG